MVKKYRVRLVEEEQQELKALVSKGRVAAYRQTHARILLLSDEAQGDRAMESPRLRFWENRLKLLLMVSLVYAFLLSLLSSDQASLVQDLLRGWCHGTGERYRQAAIPLSRLRAALSALWLTYPPNLTVPSQTSG